MVATLTTSRLRNPEKVENRHRALVVTADPLPVLRDVAKVWCDLEPRAEGSFFTSWTWIGAWLTTLAEVGFPTRRLRLVQAREGGEVAGLAVFGRGPRRLRNLGRRIIHLHQTGDATLDAIYVEYNDILVDAAAATAIRAACLAPLIADAEPMVAQAARPQLAAAIAASDPAARQERVERCAIMTLHPAADRAEGLAHVIAGCGRNTRAQISRSMRRLESHGPLAITRADASTADSFLAELMTLHTAAWQARKGLPGAFANPFLVQFVRRLVRDGVARGTVDLLRVTAGAHTVGVLLNFVHGGESFSYQSGFAYSGDNRDKPGLVCHALAAADAMSRGLGVYHFMAGESRYKTSLATGQETLTWMAWGEDARWVRAEAAARALWRRLRPANACSTAR